MYNFARPSPSPVLGSHLRTSSEHSSTKRKRAVGRIEAHKKAALNAVKPKPTAPVAKPGDKPPLFKASVRATRDPPKTEKEEQIQERKSMKSASAASTKKPTEQGSTAMKIVPDVDTSLVYASPLGLATSTDSPEMCADDDLTAQTRRSRRKTARPDRLDASQLQSEKATMLSDTRAAAEGSKKRGLSGSRNGLRRKRAEPVINGKSEVLATRGTTMAAVVSSQPLQVLAPSADEWTQAEEVLLTQSLATFTKRTKNQGVCGNCYGLLLSLIRLLQLTPGLDAQRLLYSACRQYTPRFSCASQQTCPTSIHPPSSSPRGCHLPHRTLAASCQGCWQPQRRGVLPKTHEGRP